MITFVFIKILRGLKMVEMWYGGILQLKPIVWAVEMKATRILKKIRAGRAGVPQKFGGRASTPAQDEAAPQTGYPGRGSRRTESSRKLPAAP